MRTTRDGRGYMNILAADRLMSSPQLYTTFLLWLLSELFEEMPEVGDLEKPKLVFFFDEAHLLFDDAPPGLLQQARETVKLIRSKGVGVYFVSAKSAGCARQRAGADGQPGAACVARLYAARPEGCESRRHRPLAPIRNSRRKKSSPKWARARRWFQLST